MSTTSATKTCPGCGTMVSAIRPTCRHCGTLFLEPPVPTAPLRSANDANAAPETATVPPNTATGDDRFFAPTTLAPVRVNAAPEPKRRGAAFVAVIVLAVIALGAGAYAVFGDSGTSHAKTPVAMPPHGPSNGMPGGLSDVVRIQAESSRQIAIDAITQATTSGESGALDLGHLSQASGSLTFLDAKTSSKGPHEVSFAQDGDVKTIAIAASSKEVCAFARIEPGTATQYVTMLDETSCKATDAPADGWSTMQGGSSSDLPSDDPQQSTAS
jgi:hypothetical protein